VIVIVIVNAPVGVIVAVHGNAPVGVIAGRQRDHIAIVRNARTPRLL
jgi:hypothetical protein